MNKHKAHTLSYKEGIPIIILIVAVLCCVLVSFRLSKADNNIVGPQPETITSTGNQEVHIFAISDEERKLLAIQNEPSATNHSFHMLLFGDLIYDRHVYKTMPNTDALRKHFQRRMVKNIPYQKGQTSFQNISENADFVGLNLESPIGRFWSGDREKNICLTSNKTISFCAHEDILPVLKELGFTMVNLTNNHTMDAGLKTHLKTVELLDKYGIKYFGYVRQGSHFEQNYVYTGSKNGQKFARHGYDYTIHGDLYKKYCEDLQTYHKGGYTNFVVVHRGVEYKDNHSSYQEKIAKELFACGADAIFGGHPHVVEDIATYSGKTVLYSLGNFLFDQYFDERTQVGGYVIGDYNFVDSKLTIHTGIVTSAAKR